MQANHKHTDPTYLRTIYDGLLLGTLHKDNASALPMGLVGMYEEALPPASNVNERKKFLKFFAVWALLKKEASVVFLMPLLEGWSEEIIIYYLNKYSKWFNSPQSGKYVLYQERMRAFILQKISKQQFNACNETIIKVSHDALSRRSGDEWENYALEYLSNHMLIPAIEKGDGSVLKLLAYNTTHWNRQVESSKGFEWSKRMLNSMMLWASKYDDEEVIECALNKVDLHHLEQNDAPRIVELVANNDIETALQRIESFGGNDKEGLQRKFILYMLCLMELTLLDSKDKPFCKEAIEKLLKHLDDNILENKMSYSLNHYFVNNPLSKWEEIFPSYLIFQIACVLYELDLDYLIIYKRIAKWDRKWIEKMTSFSKNELVVLLAITLRTDDFVKDSILSNISNIMAKQGQINSSIEFANKILNENKRCSTFKKNAIVFVKNGNSQEALLTLNEISSINERCKALLEVTHFLLEQTDIKLFDKLINDAIEITANITEPKTKAFFYIEIAALLIISNQLELAINIINKSLKISDELIDESDKNDIIIENSILLFRVGLTDESKISINKINDNFKKLNALLKIAGLYAENGMINKWDELIEVVLIQVSEIDDSNSLHQLLSKVSIETAKYGSIKNVLFIVRLFEDTSIRFELLIHVIYELLNKKSESEFKIILDEIEAIEDEFEFSGITEDLLATIKEDLLASKILKILSGIISIFNVQYAIQFVRIVSNKTKKYESRMMAIIFSEFIKNKEYDKLGKLIHSSQRNIDIINFYIEAIIILKDKNLFENEMIPVISNELLKLTQEIENPVSRDQIFCELAYQLSIYNKIEETFVIINKMSDFNYYRNAILKLSQIYFDNNFGILLNYDLILKFLTSSFGRCDDIEKSMILNDIGRKMLTIGKMQNVIELSKAIPYHYEKIRIYSEISIELAKNGQIYESIIWLNKIASNNDEVFKDNLAREFSTNMAYEIKCETILYIIEELDSQGNIELSERLIYELSNLVKEITYNLIKSEINNRLKKYLIKRKDILTDKSHLQEIQDKNLVNKISKRYYELLIHREKSNYLDEILRNEISQNKLNEFSKTISALNYFSIFDLFFGKPNFKKIERYNRTLNIQWAIDIKNSISAS